VTDPKPPTLADMIAEVRRELRLREVAYPRMVQRGVLTGPAAARQVARMEAVLVTLQGIEAMMPTREPEPPEAA
jgi:hypothetical protein